LLGQYHHWDKVVAHKPCEQIESMGPNDPFMIVYTSGTTGMPKGTVHTHGGFPLKVTHDAAYHFELKADDRWLWPSDMGWIVGPLTTIGCLSLGATLVCYDGAPDAPDWSRLGSIIEKLRVTHFGASPTLIRGLAANESMSTSRDLVSLRVLMAAGEVLDPEHFEWFFDKFGRSELPIINYTGGTEASGALLANVVVRPIKVSGFNSVSPGIAAFVSDVDGHRLRGQPGELAIGAPFIGMTRSFWEDDERYFETYWSVTPGFWIHGDLAFEDRDGCFYILGRSDDTLKIAGKRVGPAEVENVVMRALAVVEVAAVGLPDPIKGQALVICAVRSNPAIDDDAFARSVSDVIEAALGKPFKPAIVHCVPALPRTRNGKVMRRVVRRILCGEAPGDLSALDNPESLRHLEARMPAGGLG
jgi:acetyl-CoA synthetase